MAHPEELSRNDADLLAATASVARAMPFGFAVVDASWRIVALNDAMRVVTGEGTGPCEGKPLRDALPALFLACESLLSRALGGVAVSERIVLELPSASGSALSGHVAWQPTSCALDATLVPLRAGDEVLGVSVAVVEPSVAGTERVSSARLRLHEICDGIVDACTRSTSEKELFERVCDCIVAFDDARFAWVAEPEGITIANVAARGIDGGYFGSIEFSLDPEVATSQGPLATALRTGMPVVINDIATADIMRPWRDITARAGFMSLAVFPILLDDRPVAALVVYGARRDLFTEEFAESLTSIGHVISFALRALRVERHQRATRELLRVRDYALGAVSQGIVITDPKAPGNPIIYASPSFLRLTGYEEHEVMGRNCRFLVGPETDVDDVALISESLRAGRGCTVELLNYKKSGEPFWNLVSILPVRDEEGDVVRHIGVLTDVSARRTMERQLANAQQLESIGTLAGGVAHDFNNLMLVIRGYASALAKRTSDEDMLVAISRIDEAINRGTDLTRMLLTYSRRQVTEPTVVRLRAFVNELMALLERVLGDDIRLSITADGSRHPVRIDPTQLQQIVLNLVTNARDAMRNGGTLSIDVSAARLSGDDARHSDVDPGEYAVLTISDTGVGIHPRDRGRIFDPYFTTKEAGNGLGLPTVIGAVKQAGGHLDVESELGVGTTFRIYLPIARDAVAPRPVGVRTTSGSGAILVVEDFDEARALLVDSLRSAGFEVIEAANGLEALERFHAHGVAVDLLLTDVVMPGMNGKDLAAALSAERPGVKVIYMSGYPSTILTAKDLVDGDAVLVEKPYQMDMLIALVQATLGGAGMGRPRRRVAPTPPVRS